MYPFNNASPSATSICVVWTSGCFRKCTIRKRSQYPLLELLLSQEAPARSSRRLLYLLVNTSRDPNPGGVGQLSPIRADTVTGSSCAEQSQVFVSHRQYFLRLPTGVELGSKINFLALTGQALFL